MVIPRSERSRAFVRGIWVLASHIGEAFLAKIQGNTQFLGYKNGPYRIGVDQLAGAHSDNLSGKPGSAFLMRAEVR